MTDYYGSEVPRGDTKASSFFIENGAGQPVEPYDAEFQWRAPDGSVLETDTLAAGITRPTGSTAENDPGHFVAKYDVPAGGTIAVGYTGYLRVKPTSTSAWTAWMLVETWQVIAAPISVQPAGPHLATEQDVRDALYEIVGQSAPAGLTAGRIEESLDMNEAIILKAFGEDEISDLTDQAAQIGRRSLIDFVVADILLALFPSSLDMTTIADRRRKMALQNIELYLTDGVVANAPFQKKRASFEVV